MANVSIKFNNKEFLLACEDGQEEHLEELLIQINKKFNSLKNELDSFVKLFDDSKGYKHETENPYADLGYNGNHSHLEP